MFKGPQKTVQDNKSLSYPLFELPGVNYKCFREFRENNRFLKSFLSIFPEKVTHSYLLPYCSMLWWWLQMQSVLLANVSNKETLGDIHPNLAYFIHIWNISNIFNENSTASFLEIPLFTYSQGRRPYSIKGTILYEIVRIPCLPKQLSLWLAI